MQAVENEPVETDSAFVRHCLDQGMLRTFTPVPLGDQRQRFLALIEDMRRHGADYTSQLSMLTLAGMQRDREQRESTHALMADLLQRTDIREKEEEQLQLWQSRLMLKLGEWYDLQQADIDSTLNHIASRQDALVQALREEEETTFSLPAGAGESSREPESLLRHRLKAWSRLCFHDQSQAPGILVTCHNMALELLQEVYEKLQGQPAQTLVSLDLPENSGDAPPTASPLCAQVPALRQAVADMMHPLAPEQAAAVAQQWNSIEEQWKQLLERQYPLEQTGRCRLELVYFPGISGRRLLLEGFAGGLRSGRPQETLAEQGCCLGLLRRA
ncbi:MAG: hypothetical protein AB7E77_00220 [Desulfobulbus sp.]